MKMAMNLIQEQAETILPDKTVGYFLCISVFEFVSYFCEGFKESPIQLVDYWPNGIGIYPPGGRQ